MSRTQSRRIFSSGDPNSYPNLNASDGMPADGAAFLEEEREKNFWFEQEYMCVFHEVAGAVFSRESIEAAFVDFEPLKL